MPANGKCNGLPETFLFVIATFVEMLTSDLDWGQSFTLYLGRSSSQRLQVLTNGGLRVAHRGARSQAVVNFMFNAKSTVSIRLKTSVGQERKAMVVTLTTSRCGYRPL